MWSPTGLVNRFPPQNGGANRHSTEKKGVAGEIFYTKKQLFVFCGDGQALSITDLQLAESKRMRTVDFLNGLKTKPQSFSIE